MSESLGLTKQQAKNLMKFISDNISMPVLGAGGGFAPIGTLNYYMGTVAPQGWLICDGTVYNIADYPEFATFIASNYGSTNAFGGDGTTTFAVPDCRGEFARMIGTNSHANQGNGANIGTHQDGTEHEQMMQGIKGNVASWMGAYIKNNTETYTSSIQKYDSAPLGAAPYIRDITVSTIRSETSGNPSVVTSRPTNTSWNFIVKATVSGDANGHVYSTDEQIVGTTEDGETIYEKTIKYDGAISSTTKIGTISNLKELFGFVGRAYNTNRWRVLPYADNENYILPRIEDNGDVTILVMGVFASSTPITKTRVTVQYTKNSGV